MTYDLATQRSLQLLSTLDGNLRQIELTGSQYEQLETAYNSVAEWLAKSNHPLLRNVRIFPQGSVRLRTTVRPLGKEEFDVDLVCFLPDVDWRVHSAEFIYNLIGNRLKEHGTYSQMLSPKNRCWRLEYADGSKFHMDITPGVNNDQCINGGILVPDKELKKLKPSNPIGYADLFGNISSLVPEFRTIEFSRFTEAVAKASIEPLPDPMQPKDLLRRIVQLIKRHRDIYFQNKNGKAPISIILTTLAMEAYSDLTQDIFDNPLHFISTVINRMPAYVLATENGFQVLNPSTEGENFAEKWNKEPNRYYDFIGWHSDLVLAIKEYTNSKGLDQVTGVLRNKLLGDNTVDWSEKAIEGISGLRSGRRLSRLPISGGISLQTGSRIPQNTFFGDYQ